MDHLNKLSVWVRLFIFFSKQKRKVVTDLVIVTDETTRYYFTMMVTTMTIASVLNHKQNQEAVRKHFVTCYVRWNVWVLMCIPDLSRYLYWVDRRADLHVYISYVTMLIKSVVEQYLSRC